MSKSIHEQETDLYKEWLDSYSKEEQQFFCMDGLCTTNADWSYGREEKLWAKAKRRIVFLMKETNNNPNQDYREWQWSIVSYPTFNVIFKWLQGLSTVSETFCPFLDSGGDYFSVPNMVIGKYPLAIVNVKKIAGGSQAYTKAVKDYAERDKVFLRKQVAEILKPNIVVCCGYAESDKSFMTKIAENYIYPDLFFKKINDWCFYCKEENLLLIDSYHPGARIRLQIKIDEMMKNVQEFLKSEHPDFE